MPTTEIGLFPHCDQRILHAPSICEYCDRHPEWQALREAWGIAFTGQIPEGGSVTIRDDDTALYVAAREEGRYYFPLPCPADFNRPATGRSDHRRWAGNVATTQEPVNESAESHWLYASPDILTIEQADAIAAEVTEKVRPRRLFGRGK